MVPNLTAYRILSMLLSLLGAALLISCAKTASEAFTRAHRADTAEAYREFLKDYPHSEFAAEVRQLLDDAERRAHVETETSKVLDETNAQLAEWRREQEAAEARWKRERAYQRVASSMQRGARCGSCVTDQRETTSRSPKG